MGSGRPEAAIWIVCLGTQDGLRGRTSPGRCPVPEGISNACTMPQLTFRFDSSAPAAITASAPRMGNDENRAGGTGGPATSVIAKVKPKTKRPNLSRDQDHAPRPSSWNRGVRGVHLRNRRDQGDPGDGFCAQAPASPAMRYGKEVTLRETRQTGTGFASRIRRIRRLGAFLPGGATGFAWVQALPV